MRALVAMLFALVSLQGCLSAPLEDHGPSAESERQQKYPRYLPNSGEKGVDAVIAGAMLVADLVLSGRGGAPEALSNEIYGTCRMKLGRAELADPPCDKTYVVYTNERDGHRARAWVDHGGHFQISTDRDTVYSLEAVNEEYDFRSRPLKVRGPRSVVIEITFAHPKPGSTAESSHK